jgi:hypothetical protein
VNLDSLIAFLPDGFDPTLGPPRRPVASRRQSSRRTEPLLISFQLPGRHEKNAFGIDLEVGCRSLEEIVSTARLVVVASLITAVASGCTMTARAPSSQPQDVTPTDAQRRECERNGGYWATAAGYCRIGG